jgi:hypothetical protein
LVMDRSCVLTSSRARREECCRVDLRIAG